MIRTFATAVLFAIASQAFAEDFYEQQLQIAKIDFAAGRTVQASDELRIAAFGFLDRPVLLTEALARLALAQSVLGQTAVVSETLGRFIDVEQRFGTYASINLDDATRAKFEPLLVSTISVETLRSVPTLAKLVRTPVEAAGDLPPSRRVAAYEAGFKREPRNVQWPLALMRYYASSGDQGELVRWAGVALRLDARSAEARALLVHADTSRGQCREALNVFAGFAAAELQSRPDAYADQGVCLVENGKMAEAKAAFAKTSDAGRSRADVKKAMLKIADRDAAADSAAKAAGNPGQGKPAGSPVNSSPPTRPGRSTTSGKPAPETTAKGGKQSATTGSPDGTSRTSGANSASNATSGKPAPELAAKGGPLTSTTPGANSPPGVAVATQSKHPSAAEVLTSTHALLLSGKFKDALRDLRLAVQSEPKNRQLRLALLEAAVLAKEWPTAGAQVAVTSPFSQGEELYMFYASVALYENGQREEAKPLMERARARMVASPLVDYYINAVLANNPSG